MPSSSQIARATASKVKSPLSMTTVSGRHRSMAARNPNATRRAVVRNARNVVGPSGSWPSRAESRNQRVGMSMRRPRDRVPSVTSASSSRLRSSSSSHRPGSSASQPSRRVSWGRSNASRECRTYAVQLRHGMGGASWTFAPVTDVEAAAATQEPHGGAALAQRRRQDALELHVQRPVAGRQEKEPRGPSSAGRTVRPDTSRRA